MLKKHPSPPPDNYFELKLSINSFCALLWTLFGEDVREVMDQQEVHIIRESFTTDICRKITWAILTDRRSFFNHVLVKDHFTRTDPFR